MAAVGPDTVVIFGGKQQGEFIYQDDQCVAFEAEDKQAPVHFIVVPRKTIPRLYDATEADEKLLGHLLLVGRLVAKRLELSEGFRVVMNEGVHGGQTERLHVQVFGGRQMLWPFGHMLLVAKRIAVERGLARSGFHTLVDENHRTKKLVALHVFERSLMHMLWPTSLGSRL